MPISSNGAIREHILAHKFKKDEEFFKFFVLFVIRVFILFKIKGLAIGCYDQDAIRNTSCLRISAWRGIRKAIF